MIRPLLTVSTGTLTSRLLGFARDAMVAALLGAGPVADAFLVAFQGISVFRRALTEGALNTALVPAYLRIRDTDGAVAATVFAGRVLRRGGRRVRGAGAIAEAARERPKTRRAAKSVVRRADARLLCQGDGRHGGEFRTAIADHGRRRHRVVVAGGGVVAVFRQPADRTAA